jgi:photosystem II stability/assembly factor-like uncharacterized protein
VRAAPAVVSEFVGTALAPAARPVAAGGAGGARTETVYGRAGGAAVSVPVRWRILASGNVERSTSDGTSWERIAIDPPAFITAGDAPTSMICWLVGRGGVVLRTTDSLHFDRLNVPDSANLVSVRALDATHATVTTVNGRVLTTVDGGLSWQSPQ